MQAMAWNFLTLLFALPGFACAMGIVPSVWLARWSHRPYTNLNLVPLVATEAEAFGKTGAQHLKGRLERKPFWEVNSMKHVTPRDYQGLVRPIYRCLLFIDGSFIAAEFHTGWAIQNFTASSDNMGKSNNSSFCSSIITDHTYNLYAKKVAR